MTAAITVISLNVSSFGGLLTSEFTIVRNALSKPMKLRKLVRQKNTVASLLKMNSRNIEGKLKARSRERLTAW